MSEFGSLPYLSALSAQAYLVDLKKKRNKNMVKLVVTVKWKEIKFFNITKETLRAKFVHCRQPIYNSQRLYQIFIDMDVIWAD